MADSRLGGHRVPVFNPVQHFWNNVDKSGGPSACWPWQMSVIKTTGYGQMYNKAVGRKATHVYAYELEIGPVPEGHHIDHTCHNEADCPGGKDCPHRRCCNPAHLEAVPPRENSRRANAPRGRGNQKTHCPQNHKYDEKNTMWIKKVRKGKTYNTRMCRTCNRERARERKART